MFDFVAWIAVALAIALLVIQEIRWREYQHNRTIQRYINVCNLRELDDIARDLNALVYHHIATPHPGESR